MEKLKGFRKIVLCIGLVLCSFGLVQGNIRKPVTEKRDIAVTNLIKSAERWLGVREVTGNNDHPMITKAMRLCGLPGNKGYAWCAASQAEIHEFAGVNSPHSARVVDWFRQNVVWESNWGCISPGAKPGMVGALYYQDLKRYGHVVLIIGEDRNNYYTYEGNTNFWGSREGEGFYKKIRSKKDISALSDYCVSGKDFIELYDEFIQNNKK